MQIDRQTYIEVKYFHKRKLGAIREKNQLSCTILDIGPHMQGIYQMDAYGIQQVLIKKALYEVYTFLCIISNQG
ncbi:MAG: hypothetical protein K1X49_06555 [Saprospiraceae bacterium]|nr:hypothetical protein [Saprospiraceae bacterium]